MKIAAGKSLGSLLTRGAERGEAPCGGTDHDNIVSEHTRSIAQVSASRPTEILSALFRRSPKKHCLKIRTMRIFRYGVRDREARYRSDLSVSRTTSSASLSSRNPRKLACLRWPSVVHSVNSICATSLGFNHRQFFISSFVHAHPYVR